jgi:hypothetical protein
MFKSIVQLKNGKYLSAPPVEGKRPRLTSVSSKAYNFGSRSAANIARSIAGARVETILL